MNELYEKTIVIDGKTYRYDPDYDCYYRVPVKLSAFDKWAWIVTSIILLVVVLVLEWSK